ncbi:hypothetical protein EC968_001391 [Mortierella alpina]|nr:hypothetical protein EC968_001391 [Mortierella alpina]
MRKTADSYVFYLFALLRQRQRGYEPELERPRHIHRSADSNINSMSALRFSEGYIKPRETRSFARSARNRASIRALGSITYLQKYYASGGTICEGFLDYDKLSFLDLIAPRAGLMDPSPEVLLRNCHEDIQTVLEIWGIISYPSPSAHATDGHEQALDSPTSIDDNDLSRQLGHHGKEFSSHSLNTHQQHRYDSISIDLLALLESSTKAISSIRMYSMHAPVLTPSALTIHRQAALSVIEMLCILEQENRILEAEDESSPEGYCYARLNFGDLEEEREEMRRYLAIVQEYLFKPQADKIETHFEKLLITNPSTPADGARLPSWLNDDQWDESTTLEFFRPETRSPLPSPSADKNGFLDALSDGYVMCMVFNAFVRLTKMPFGLVDKVNDNTIRTWRAAENWRFLIQACKFRLEFKITDGAFRPIEIVRRTDLGREQLETWVKLIVERGIQEAKEMLENKAPLSPMVDTTAFPDF